MRFQLLMAFALAGCVSGWTNVIEPAQPWCPGVRDPTRVKMFVGTPPGAQQLACVTSTSSWASEGAWRDVFDDARRRAARAGGNGLVLVVVAQQALLSIEEMILVLSGEDGLNEHPTRIRGTAVLFDDRQVYPDLEYVRTQRSPDGEFQRMATIARFKEILRWESLQRDIDRLPK